MRSNWPRLVALTLFVTGCAQAEQRCSSVWYASNQKPIDLMRTKPFGLAVQIEVLGEVARCHIPKGSLTFSGDHFIDDQHRRYVVFHTRRVDEHFAVVVDKDNKIVQAGRTTMNF